MRVDALGVYPVKSLRGFTVDEARLEPWGFEGDRRWMVVDPDGAFITQRSTPAMSLVHAHRRTDGAVVLSTAASGSVVLDPVGAPESVVVWKNTVKAVGGDPAADTWLSEVLDRPVHLVHLDHPEAARPIDPDYARPGETVTFADGYPVLVTTTASLDAVNDWQVEAGARTVPMDRFRPSIVVDTDEPWAEDAWAELAVGDVRLRVAKSCSRCVVTGVVPDTGTIEPGGPLTQIGAHRPDVSFGVNAVPSVTGIVRVGDPVEVLTSRAG